jgi:hypothetical protein
MTLILKYDPVTLPLGVSPDTLYISYWDGSQWHKLTSTIDTVADTVTALVPHFTDFAVIGQVVTTAPTKTIPTKTKTIAQWWLLPIIGVAVVAVILIIIGSRRRRTP